MVSVFNFLVPVFGVVLSAIVLGESILERKNLVALVQVCLCIRWVTWENWIRAVRCPESQYRRAFQVR